VARWRAHRALALASCAGVLLVAAAWWYWPADASIVLAGLLEDGARWRASPWTPCVVLAAFALGGLVVFPVNLLIAATIVVLGPLPGALFALAGSTLSATLTHEIGRALPATTTSRWFGMRGERLRRRVVGHGILAIALVRLLPVAPFSIVGFFSGVARVRRRDYLLGTALGMAPGIALYALFLERARAVLLDPHPLQWLGLVGAAALLLATALGLRHWHHRAEQPR
jgi:uncharacterized membrane protein YdjX (TVP38/TMEM64 family)